LLASVFFRVRLRACAQCCRNWCRHAVVHLLLLREVGLLGKQHRLRRAQFGQRDYGLTRTRSALQRQR